VVLYLSTTIVLYVFSRLIQNRKIFAFYEAEDLACCGVTFMLALALADNAFENKFTSLRDIYSLIVPPDTDRIRLQWDDEWAERPVFRDVERTANGVRVSKIKAQHYTKHRHHLVRLGRTCGFEKRLEFYDLRRASGKRLNGKFLATPIPLPATLLP
jgi:hypothetical protein